MGREISSRVGGRGRCSCRSLRIAISRVRGVRRRRRGRWALRVAILVRRGLRTVWLVGLGTPRHVRRLPELTLRRVWGKGAGVGILSRRICIWIYWSTRAAESRLLIYGRAVLLSVWALRSQAAGIGSGIICRLGLLLRGPTLRRLDIVLRIILLTIGRLLHVAEGSAPGRLIGLLLVGISCSSLWLLHRSPSFSAAAAAASSPYSSSSSWGILTVARLGLTRILIVGRVSRGQYRRGSSAIVRSIQRGLLVFVVRVVISLLLRRWLRLWRRRRRLLLLLLLVLSCLIVRHGIVLSGIVPYDCRPASTSALLLVPHESPFSMLLSFANLYINRTPVCSKSAPGAVRLSQT